MGESTANFLTLLSEVLVKRRLNLLLQYCGCVTAGLISADVTDLARAVKGAKPLEQCRSNLEYGVYYLATAPFWCRRRRGKQRLYPGALTSKQTTETTSVTRLNSPAERRAQSGARANRGNIVEGEQGGEAGATGQQLSFAFAY